MAAAGELPARLGVELADAAEEAFTQAMQVAAALSAALAIGGAIVAISLLRRVRAGSELGGAGGPGPEPERVPAGGRPC